VVRRQAHRVLMQRSLKVGWIASPISSLAEHPEVQYDDLSY
jgi:hypothetical protein